MNNIYFIQQHNKPIPDIGNIKVISFGNMSSDDFSLDGFINKHLPKTQIKVLIIPTRLWDKDVDNTGLHLALHIRLTKTYPNRFIPIIFISNETKEEILSSQIAEGKSHSAMQLFTKGCQLVEWDLKKMVSVIDNFSNTIDDEKDFLENVYPHFIIDKAENVGNHSLANKWGILQLAKAANIDETVIIEKHPALQKFRANLYVKYLLAKSVFRTGNTQKQTITETLDTQKEEKWKKMVKGKKILLIDDEAEKGWETILKKIFEGATIDTISQKVANFHDFLPENQEKIINGNYDLFLLDLRLNPTEEEKTEFIQSAKTTEYSGAKILKKIKELNPGNQVIVFTASNKAWNLKELMQAGYEADGYYMKESPDFYFDADFSQKNFENLKSEAGKCFEKGYLRDLFNRKKEILKELKNLKKKPQHKEIVIQIDEYLKLSLNNLKDAEIHTQYSISFLLLFQILESLHTHFVNSTSENGYIKYRNGKSLMKLSLKNNKIYEDGDLITKDIKKLKDITYPHKIYNLIHTFFKIENAHKWCKMAETIVADRNNVIHPPDEISRKKVTANDCRNIFDLVEVVLLKLAKDEFDKKK